MKSLCLAIFVFGAWTMIPPVMRTVKRLCPVRPSSISDAQAVSQFARKYNMSCNACHTAFPRLNAFGERFKANGFQMPGTQDGDEAGKSRVTDRLFIDSIGNLFGLRIAVNPLQVKSKSLDRDGNGSRESTLVNTGTADWLQLFTAGTIYKNVSIFIETEISGNADNTIKNNWFYLGWHNIAGKDGAMSARLGNIPQADHHVMSGRLRMIPNINIQGMSERKSSEDSASPDDQVSAAGAYPGIEVFGLPSLGENMEGVYSVGVTQGKKQANDSNELKNVFGTLGLRVKGGDFDGSQVSVFGKNARDTDTSAGGLASNRWFVVSPGFNVRYKDLDGILAFFYAEDSNGNLSLTAPKKIKSYSIAGQLGYSLSRAWWTGVQYDWVDSNDRPREDFNKISPTIWFFPRENMRVGLVGRLDFQGTNATAGHPDKIHELLVHVRTMF
ncbi:MAG: hypothetical protein A2636_02495 [Elusimicrobia bacterium RIFCSPHIGHO2_01_FULL_64_10]|nr:MAG: hypothetical protein A2636_02495 [Elusimicrobia bacterium RIFCSPHIGHO2_01_FULL_64_10]